MIPRPERDRPPAAYRRSAVLGTAVVLSLAVPPSGGPLAASAAHAAASPDRVTVTTEGEPGYRLDGDLASGGIAVTDAIGDFATAAIRGQGTLPGADGGTATVSLDVTRQALGRLSGSFTLHDPAADVQISATVSGGVTTPSDGTVTWQGPATVHRGSQSSRRTVRLTVQDRTLDPGGHAVRIEHAGQDRRALVTLPDGYDGSPLPVLFHFPGLFETPALAERFGGMAAHARTRGFIMVTAEHYGRGWQGVLGGSSVPDVDDPGFVTRLQDVLVERFNADPRRLYASGMSNGGFFTSKMACENDRFAAYAPVGGQLQDAPNCRPGRPVPIVLVHGDADPIVPYGSAPAAARFFAGNNGCGPDTTVTDLPDTAPEDGTTVARHEHRNCPPDAPVVLYQIKGGGHHWPGGTPYPLRLLGANTADIDANEVIWNFVSRFRLP